MNRSQTIAMINDGYRARILSMDADLRFQVLCSEKIPLRLINLAIEAVADYDDFNDAQIPLHDFGYISIGERQFAFQLEYRDAQTGGVGDPLREDCIRRLVICHPEEVLRQSAPIQQKHEKHAKNDLMDIFGLNPTS